MFITECVFDNTHIVGTSSIEYWHVLDKQDVKQNISHICFLIRSVAVKII